MYAKSDEGGMQVWKCHPFQIPITPTSETIPAVVHLNEVEYDCWSNLLINYTIPTPPPDINYY